MKIKQKKNGVTIVNNKSECFNLTWPEFWAICRQGAVIDTINEVKEYITQCEKIAGVNAETILQKKKLISHIADAVISLRLDYETGDDIFETAYRMIKQWRLDQHAKK